MFDIAMLNPADLHRPVGPYSQACRVKFTELVFIAGQTAVDMHGNSVGIDDVEEQSRQVFANVEAALRSAGATWRNVVHFTNYLTKQDDLAAFAKYRNQVFPTWFPNGAPPNTLLFIDRLLRKEFRVEVQAIAAL
jgi:enamine deaminase RidA (YjgF/YER057c/UK114 family)